MATAQKEAFIIEGLAGEKKLSGTVRIHGAKNAALKAIAASVLFAGPVRLENVPKTADIETLSKILRKLGAKVEWKKGGTGKDAVDLLEIDTTTMNSIEIDAELAGSMRASVVLTGPMLARFGKVTFPAPGGCVIGTRPIDLFLSGYEKMGAMAVLDEAACVHRIEAYKNAKGTGTGKGLLAGTEIFFNKVSVGGTETLMMAAVLAEGTTVLKNCAMEPEIVNVAEWLIACGAKITGVGTPVITIEGTGGELLKPTHFYTTIPDRIETGSFLILGALLARDLTIENCRPDHVESVVSLLTEAGVPIKIGASTITISGNTAANSSFKTIADLRTHEYPGFPTDLQPVIVAYLTQVTGESKIFETIYEGRFKYVEDLKKLGASITIMNPREIEVKGPTPLRHLPGEGDLTAYDIRAGFAVVMAALSGSGTFKVINIHLIDRGYEKLEAQLSSLGAQIKRVVV
ncbi:MAG: UDP-N-acetylglucosamine 1-carboxyvinyltransferase, UDP-N-acetylglucosamine 1-carboxyvinyltransferase [Candidatus Parcubacteria bacterium]|nr:UDP-N-acetylglucosamine 1-carboxyvinyltransferase, UDP-N-acetylglucosamine 1-carboxyvinyltransferase [Candidatus Parcubacteria bacterium]